MHPKVFDMLYVILVACWIRVLCLLIRILAYLAESFQLRCLHLKIHRQHVGANAAGKARVVAELLRRRFRQEWNAVSEPDAVVPASTVAIHRSQEKWPGE